MAGPYFDSEIKQLQPTMKTIEPAPDLDSMLIAPGADVDVHTSSAGTLVVLEAGVGVQVPRRVTHTHPMACSIPVSQH